MHRSCAPLDTPIGRLWVSVSPRGLVSVDRGEAPPPGAARDDNAVAYLVAELAGYFAGEKRELTAELDLSGASAFDTAVWTAARTIPYGGTVSYGELALMAGHPGAARAVGGAMARCPFSPVVPCHRVIRADGSIGGWGADTWVKRWLLDLERRAAPLRGSPPRY
ncbi:MAG TPA: methylated-DNA--[protein]-cysteine S-methyltransferase [Candidatus Limnocylindria bacterium]